MRGRDLQVSVVALFAAYLTLQYTPDVDIQLRWILPGSSESKQPKVPVPLPLVTDLDGDGHNDILLLTDGGKRVTSISVPYASGETWVEPVIRYEQGRGSDKAQRPVVAIAVDNLDMWQGKSSNKKGVVVVRDNWEAQGYSGTLHLDWTYPLKNDASLKDGSSYVVDQAAITFAPLKDGKLRGLVIGGSMRRRNGGRETVGKMPDDDAAGATARGDARVSGVHMESFTHMDEEDSNKQFVPTGEQLRSRTAAEHFSLFALDSKGKEVWRHESTVGDGKSTGVPEQSNLLSKFGLSQLKDIGTNTDAMLFRGLRDLRGLREAKGGSRVIRKALLSLLPHLWSDPVDTRLEVHYLPGGRPGHCVASSNEGETSHISSPGGGSRTRASGGDSNGTKLVDKKIAGIWAVVAHTREGMEAVGLNCGIPLGVVALPAAAGGAGVYADLNGDSLVDHIQAVGTKGAHGWAHVLLEGATRPSGPPNATSQADKLGGFPPCYAVAVSGLPPREQLFNGSLCHNGGALSTMKMNRAKSRTPRESEVMAATPAVVSRVAPSGASKAAKVSATPGRSEDAWKGHARGRRWDVVFAVSSGVVTSYDSEGRLNWQSKLGPTWEREDLARIQLRSREEIEGSDKTEAGRDDKCGERAVRSGSGSSTSDQLQGEGNGKGGGYVVPFHLEATDRNARSDASGYTAGQYILVAGQTKMCIFDPMGNVVGSTPLAFPPKKRPVAGDFDADGFTDFVIVGGDGSFAGYALAPDPGIRALFMLVVAMVITMLVVVAVYVPASDRSRARGAAPKRSTD